MKMWNLTKGRCSFTTKLASEAAIVKFFPQAGESYALVLGTVVEIRDAETGRTFHSLQHDKKVFCTAQQEVFPCIPPWIESDFSIPIFFIPPFGVGPLTSGMDLLDGGTKVPEFPGFSSISYYYQREIVLNCRIDCFD